MLTKTTKYFYNNYYFSMIELKFRLHNYIHCFSKHLCIDFIKFNGCFIFKMVEFTLKLESDKNSVENETHRSRKFERQLSLK